MVVVAGHADEEVEIAVAVDVGEGGGARVARHHDARGGRRLFEGAVSAVVEEARRSEGVGDEEVRIPVTVDVAGGDPRRGDAFGRRLRESGLLGHVGEASVSVVAVQDRAHAVGHEEVLVTVPVVVEHGDARAGPEVGEEVVDEFQRRIAPRRAETGLGGGVVKSGRGLDAVPERALEAQGRARAARDVASP